MRPNKTDQRTGSRKHESAAKRQRVGRIVHDERGNGRLEWVDVTDKHGFLEDTLELKDGPLSIQQDADSFNPYERTPAGKSKDQRIVKRDLRKLSEWIKTTRAVEEKKARGEDDD